MRYNNCTKRHTTFLIFPGLSRFNHGGVTLGTPNRPPVSMRPRKEVNHQKILSTLRR